TAISREEHTPLVLSRRRQRLDSDRDPELLSVAWLDARAHRAGQANCGRTVAELRPPPGADPAPDIVVAKVHAVVLEQELGHGSGRRRVNAEARLWPYLDDVELDRVARNAGPLRP